MFREGYGGLYEAPTKEEIERLREERDQIKFIDLRFERWQAVGFRNARRRHVLRRCWDLKESLMNE